MGEIFKGEIDMKEKVNFIRVPCEKKDNLIYVRPLTMKQDDNGLYLETINGIKDKHIIERTYIVKKFIKSLLFKINEKSINVDERNSRIINYWEKYIMGFKETELLDKKVESNSLTKTLTDKVNLFIDILEDNDNKYYLLLDKKISPEVISFNNSTIKEYYKEVVEEINLTIAKSAGKVGIVNPGQGVFLKWLLNNLNEVEQVDLIGGTSLTNSYLKEKYKNINFLKWKFLGDSISGEIVGKYDYLFMVNVGHQFKDIELTINLLSLTLNENGILYLTDFINMDPISVLIAIFFQEQYLCINNKIRNEFFYNTNYLETIFKSMNIIADESNISIKDDTFCAFIKSKSDFKSGIQKFLKNNNLMGDSIVVILNDDIDLNKINIDPHRKEIELQEVNYKKINNYYRKLERLSKLWQDNLEIQKEIDENSNYFKLGGDSLLATKLILSIKEEFGFDLNLSDIFSNANFKDMLALIEEKEYNNDEVIEGEI